MLGFLTKYKVYRSIHDCPMSVFNMVQETGDYSHLVYKGKSKDVLEHVWEKIYNEYLKEFGLNEKYSKYIKLKVAEAVLLKDAHVNGNRISLTFAAFKAHEANQILLSLGSFSQAQSLATVSKHMGFAINLDTVTVFQYMGYLKLMNGKD